MKQDDPKIDEAAAPAPEAGNGDRSGLKDQVMEALRQVNDPELGINIVDLGLVYDVEIEGSTVHITYTLTTMGCPIGPLIETQIQQMLEGVEGVDGLEAEMVMSPPWTPDKMSEEAKAALGMF
ncbi:MAG: metal-sulfur cluster assembly factor [Actinomycetota bacterium]